MSGFPVLHTVVLDTVDTRALAEFYRQLLGLEYREGDEPEAERAADDDGWLQLDGADGRPRLSFQRVPKLPEVTWPEGDVPQQLHLDLTVRTADELVAQREKALALGARLLLDRFDDDEEPLYVFADPAGHPFCIFVR